MILVNVICVKWEQQGNRLSSKSEFEERVAKVLESEKQTKSLMHPLFCIISFRQKHIHLLSNHLTEREILVFIKFISIFFLFFIFININFVIAFFGFAFYVSETFTPILFQSFPRTHLDNRFHRVQINSTSWIFRLRLLVIVQFA